MFEIYKPIIKQKGFDPSPFAGNIPYYADSITNPKCYGTPAHLAFWEEIFYYCINGYNTGGLYIPGEYFEYLNFKTIDGPRGPQHPDFIDLHYQLYEISEDIKYDRSKVGLLIPKARRKGLSFWGDNKISYGMKFTERYRAAIAAGLQTFVDGFRSKLYRIYNETAPELRMNHLIRNSDSLILGYEEASTTGPIRTESAVVLFKTMKDDAAKLEGEYFNDVILEELGEFELAEEAIISISPALMDGDDYIGKIWGYGTGGKMKKGGATFQQIVSNAGSLSFDTIFIPGRRMYFPYVVRKNNKVVTPYLDEQYPGLSKEDELLGCEDLQAASEALKKKEKQLAQSGDRKNLVQHKQNFPEELKDVFVSPGSNSFNIEKLFMQKFAIDSSMQRYAEYCLDFVMDRQGKAIMPLRVVATIPKKSDPEWKRVKILNGHMPIAYSRDLDIVGVDGYQLDSSRTSKSLGGIIVIRRNDMFPDDKTILYPGLVPTLIYYQRPPRKEIFWEIALKVSIFCNAVKNTMIGVDADSLIGYYKEMGGKKYLSPRPRSFESDKSEQMHEFGYKSTSFSIPRVLSLQQSWVEDYAIMCWYHELLLDLIAFDEINIGNDYDLADALGHALIRIQDMKRKPSFNHAISEDQISLPEWREDENGNIVMEKSPFNTVKKNAKMKEEIGGWKQL